MKYGSKNISKLQYGSKNIIAAYWGSKKIFENKEALPEEPEDTLELITFTIDGIEYQAEKSMTWEEWCESEYNTIQIVARNTGSDTKVVGLNPPFSILIFKGTSVFGHDLIITGGIYIQQYSDF